MEINFLNFRCTIPKAALYIAVPVLALVIGTIGYSISRGDGSIIVSKSEPASGEQTVKTPDTKETAPVEATVEAVPQKAPEDEIQVYVTGCVRNQGIVLLKKGQIIDDAIKAAGGATEEADLSDINLVYKLTGNVMLKIKSKKEMQAAPLPKQSTDNPDTGNEAGKGAEIVKGDGGAIVSDPAPAGGAGGKVNINTATEEQLDTLPGVGASTAKDILGYREKSGPFKSIEEIMNVPGIKESRFSKIKDLITVK